MRMVFFGLAIASVAVNVAVFIMILAAFDARGRKTNLVAARAFPFKTLSAYREETRKETGKSGPLYLLWVISINLVWIFGAAALLWPRG